MSSVLTTYSLLYMVNKLFYYFIPKIKEYTSIVNQIMVLTRTKTNKVNCEYLIFNGFYS